MDSKSKKAKSRYDAGRVGDKAMLHVHLFQEEQKKSPKANATGREPATLPAAALPSTDMSIIRPAPTSQPNLRPLAQPTPLKPGPSALNQELIQQKGQAGCRDENILDKSTDAASLSPHHHDVIRGKGKANYFFNNLVKAVIIEFVATPKELQHFFATEVLNQIRALNPPGRFLDHDKKTGVYSEVCNKRAVLEKTRQALRDVKSRFDVERKIKSGEINVKEEITYGNIPEIIRKKAMKVYAETFPHSISINESAGGQGPVYDRLALDSTSARSIHSMMYDDWSAWKFDNLAFCNAHAKKPGLSSFPMKDTLTSTSDIPSVFSTSDARTSISLSPSFLRSSGIFRAGDDVPSAHHDPALGIDCFPGMESAAARHTGQLQCDHHDGSRSTKSRSPSLFSYYESGSFDLEMSLPFQDHDNDTTEAMEDGG